MAQTGPGSPPPPTSRKRPRAAGALLLLPVAGLLWVPAYAREEPRLLDVPFFYWYQLTWIVAAMACMAGAALLLPTDDREGTP